MSGITGALMVTSLLAQAPTASAPPSAVGADMVVSSASAPAKQQAQPGEGQPAQPTERLHEVGLGASIGFGSAGGGGAFRFFFGDRLGVNVSAGFARPTGGRASASQGSTFYVAPSMVYMLTKSRQMNSIDVRPYVGGGVNYVNGASQVRTSSSVSGSTSGVGTQVFGGVEVTFLDAKSLAISAEVAHYQTAVPSYSSGLAQGTNFYLMFHYYLK